MKRIKSNVILMVIIFAFALDLGSCSQSLKESSNALQFSNISGEVDDLTNTAHGNQQPIISDVIKNQEGKLISEIQSISSNCMVNNLQSSLSNQPKIYLDDWNVTHAEMAFTNIRALNYTRDIELEPSNFIANGDKTPLFIFQKFSVEISQYINNISIFIQDIANMDVFNDTNSWEIAILNCSKDIVGTPNTTLGVLKKPHPTSVAAHWETFDFQHSDQGAIYLNTSRTKSTSVNGQKKYWFAYKVRIPPDDSEVEGGIKLLYFNPDGEDPEDVGEGETFRFYEGMYLEQYITNNVSKILAPTPINGSYLSGDLNSFIDMDDDRYVAEAKTNNLSLLYRFNIRNHTIGYPYAFLRTVQELFMLGVFSVDIYVSLKIENIDNVDHAALYVYNSSEPGGEWISLKDDINITTDDETEMVIKYSQSEEIRKILYFMNTTNNNSLDFKFVYNGSAQFRVSINKFMICFGELHNIENQLPQYDPVIDIFQSSVDAIERNGTLISGNLNSLKYNDNTVYFVETKGTNLTVELKFEILSDYDESLWSIPYSDWSMLYPTPYVPCIQLRISSNVSINHQNNLSLATIEVFKGLGQYDFLTDKENEMEWLPLLEDNQTLENKNEFLIHEELDCYTTWKLLHFLNSSEQNTLRLRVRYLGNETFQGFNVSLDEFSLVVKVQNLISVDLASKIGCGVSNEGLSPSRLGIELFGTSILDKGTQKGEWIGSISNGVPEDGYFELSVTSIWPLITFYVEGLYSVEKSVRCEWQYSLYLQSEAAYWDIFISTEYLEDSIESTNGFDVNVPLGWKVMELFDCSGDSEIKYEQWLSSSNLKSTYQTLSIYNITEGDWKLICNSSLLTVGLDYNATGKIYIDNELKITASVIGDYGGNLSISIFDENYNPLRQVTSHLNALLFQHSHLFTWKIDENAISEGEYYITIHWIKHNQTTSILGFDFATIFINKYSTKLELLNLDESEIMMMQGTTISIQGRFSYNESGIPISDESILIEITNNNQVIEDMASITNKDGLIRVEYTLPDIDGQIEIRLKYNSSMSCFCNSESNNTMKILILPPSTYYLHYFLAFLPYILLSIGIITAALGLRYFRLNSLRRTWNTESQIYNDATNISYILIYLKDVGVSIFDKQVSSQVFDPNLISGFLNALAHFKGEIMKESSSEEKGFEMDYHDFKIIIMEGTFIRVALFLNQKPSKTIRSKQSQFITEFEEKYQKYLEGFDGEISVFENALELIIKYFNIDLNSYYQRKEKINEKELKPLEKVMYNIAGELMKEKISFTILNVINFSLAGRKEEKEQIVSATLSLIHKKIFISEEK